MYIDVMIIIVIQYHVKVIAWIDHIRWLTGSRAEVL